MPRLKLNKRKIIIFILSAIFLAGLFNFGNVFQVQAQTASEALGLTQEVQTATGLGAEDIRMTIAKIIRVLLGLLGIAALLVVLYGGYMYMTAGGNDQQVGTAKKIIINGVIGLVIILSSFAITQFILNKLGEATGLTSTTIPPNCADPIFAAANPAICDPLGFNPCTNLDNQFVVKSITPSTPAGSTGMNDFAVRVIFSQGVDLTAITAADVFNIERGGVNVNSEFNFLVLDADNKVIQAASTAPMSEEGNYTVTVLSTLTSVGGLDLETANVCGDFPSSVNFNVDTPLPPGTNDIQLPTVLDYGPDDGDPATGDITYNNTVYGGAIALPRGRTHRIGAKIIDDHGVGYIHLEVQRRNSATNIAIGAPLVFYDGPRVVAGSSATLTNPYSFGYNLLLTNLTPLYNDATEPSYFEVRMIVTDIDSNVRTITSNFIVVEGSCAFGTGAGSDIGCRGNGACVADFDCLSGVCDENSGQCLAVPVITDVSPWVQAGGKWVTISGQYFGANEGGIDFGIDNNADNNPDVWVPANVASCNGADVWNSNYIIAEVPRDDLLLPNNSLSSVRVRHEVYIIDPITNADFYDTSTDSRGARPGPLAGWFTKDNSLSLPGLCAIAPNSGLPETAVSIFGQDLGAGGAGSLLTFGGISAPISLWQADGARINTSVPANMAVGTVGVVATVNGIQSNGLPFRIMSEEELLVPVIESITPENTTRESYITISGQRFGDNPGVVYLAPDVNTVCPNVACVVLNTTLPVACGDTWDREQIIAEVPATAPIAQGIIIVENEFNLQSQPAEANRLNVQAGGAMPSICALSPNKGIAPLENAQAGVTLTGVNFSANPLIYFWGRESVATNNASWLALPSMTVVAGNINTVLTKIPVDFAAHPLASNPLVTGSGFSMQTGPIKLRAVNGTGQESNTIKYTVDDCRSVPATRWPTNMRCCAEGPSAGSFIEQSFICPGESRTGGYVWRFTTGLFPNLPRVIEACDNTTISPTPWREQGNGEAMCLNAQIQMSFSMPMNAATINQTNIHLYTCGNGAEPDCDNKVEVLPSEIMAGCLPSAGDCRTVVVRDAIAQGDLEPNTWYHIELSDLITGVSIINVLGVPEITYPALLKTRSCGNGTAYCFDFKTDVAGSQCVLTGVTIDPVTYSVDSLGPVINKNTGTDLIYFLFGRGDRECSVLPVEGLGWNWTATDTPPAMPVQTSATVTRNAIRDILATAVALQEPPAPSTKVQIQAATNYNGYPLLGLSDLFITLGPPKVIEYWPNCGEACINAGLGAKFNRMMDPSTFTNANIHLYSCPNENACILAIVNNSVIGLTAVPINILPDPFTNRMEAQFVPTSDLEQGTSYLVYFDSGIMSVGQVDINNNIIRQGLPLEEKMWQFKTKSDGGFCIAERVETRPDPFTAYYIGENTRYTATPYTNPDQCSPTGQILNPWGFGWSWSTGQTNVAIVSGFATAGQVKTNCNYGCLPVGSDIAKGMIVGGLCGNGILEPGEDCDVGVAIPTDSCALDCQRPGNNNVGTGAGQCGNGFVDTAQGEECDNGLTSATRVGCTAECTHEGSTSDPAQASAGQPLCGSGSVTVGEDCEPGLNNEVLGVTCTVNCLHVGTRTFQEWCDDNVGYASRQECLSAASVCGNNLLEAGEECETIGGIVRVFNGTDEGVASIVPITSCSDSCLLQNICGTDAVNMDLGCDYTTVGVVGGCNSDCTKHGSAVDEYDRGSICGDGVIATGEFGWCEYTAAELASFEIPGQNPVQSVVAVGTGVVVDNKQETVVTSLITRVRGASAGLDLNNQALLNSVTDSADYTLQCGFTEYERVVNVPGLVAWWTGDNTYENSVVDLWDATPVGSDVSFAEGIFGQAFKFGAATSVGNYLQIDGTPLNVGANNFTISAWFKTADTYPDLSGGMMYLFQMNNGGLLSPFGPTIHLRLRQNQYDNYMAFGVNGTTNATYYAYRPGLNYNDNEWHNFIGIRNGNTIIVYLDGVEVARYAGTAATVGSMNLLTPTLRIGNFEYRLTRAPFTGLIDEFKIFNRAIGPEEILEVMNNNNQIDRGNDCQDQTHGVGYNSCCYERPRRIDEYPLDGSGFSGGPADEVCRNTAITVTFDADIDEASLQNNLSVVRGYATAEDCAAMGQTDLSIRVSHTLAYANLRSQSNTVNDGGFWQNILNTVKKFFAWLVNKVQASAVSNTITNVLVWCSTDLVLDIPTITKIKDTNGIVTQSIVNVALNELLEADATYAVLLDGGKTGIKSVTGVGISSPDLAVSGRGELDDSFVFHTGNEICRINSIMIDPDSHIYTAPQTQQLFTASALSVNGQRIQSIPNIYDWSWSWGMENDPFFTIPNVTTANNSISSKDVEGESAGHAYAAVTADLSVIDNQVGQVFRGDAQLKSVFCENPWPTLPYYPYEDGVTFGTATITNNDGTDGSGNFDGSAMPMVGGNYFNYSVSYCADNGRQSDVTDDLPYLRPFVFTTGLPDPENLKRILFFNDINNDAIGIQVFRNDNRDSVVDWFRKRHGEPTGFKRINIAGYEGLTDGNNYYINALNVVGANAYHNIYVFSLNENAQANTQKVFDKMMDSLDFNINFSDVGYCLAPGADLLTEPNNISMAGIACTTDFDCLDENGNPLSQQTAETNGICSNIKTKLRRDWDRIVSLKSAQDKIASFGATPPALQSGTYIPGQTRSVWPSWGNLGSQIGGLGVDPINKWTSCNYCSNDTTSPLTLCLTDEDCGAGNTCVTVDSQTCWDNVNSRFICPRVSSVFGYRVQNNGDYTLSGPMEYFPDVSTFLDTNNNHFVIGDPICSPGAVISPLAGACGNSVVNTGETCDPPGQNRPAGLCDIAPGTNNGNAMEVCSSACAWVATTICQPFNVCGNGRKEGVEFCDQGSLNGSYGHCNVNCSNFSTNYCGNSVIDRHCSHNIAMVCTNDFVCAAAQPFSTCVADEVCDNGATNGNYASGCSLNCQDNGPRCGDGIMQTDSVPLEQCDDGNTTSGDGCSAVCVAEALPTPTPLSLIPATCGNGAVDAGEACDRGVDENGIQCNPKYGEYCNYCSYDCGEVLYVEPAGYCGNQAIDIIEAADSGVTEVREECEYLLPVCDNNNICSRPSILRDGLFTRISIPIDSCKENSNWDTDPQSATPYFYTTYSGEYRCEDQCTNFQNGCVLCGHALTTQGGVLPRMLVLNPMLGADDGTDWFSTALSAKFYFRRFRSYDNSSGVTTYEIDIPNGIESAAQVRFDQPKTSLFDYIFYDNNIAGEEIYPDGDSIDYNNRGIISNPICNDVYHLCFNTDLNSDCLGRNLDQNSSDFQYLWPYKVSGETATIDNEYILSPNPPPGSIRVVLKWTLADNALLNNGSFGLGILNSDATTNYFNSAPSDICDSIEINQTINYWVPDDTCSRNNSSDPFTVRGGGRDGVYMHELANGVKVFMQSMTINLYDDSFVDVSASLMGGAPFAVFAEAQGSAGGIPINGLIGSNVQVQIFENHNTLDPGIGDFIFKPDLVFEIKYAQRSSNPAARYWHIFNIIENPDTTAVKKYVIEPVQKIRTDSSSLLQGALNINFIEGAYKLLPPPCPYPNSSLCSGGWQWNISASAGTQSIPYCGNDKIDPGEVCDGEMTALMICKADCSGWTSIKFEPPKFKF